MSINDFEIIKQIGSGAFSTVSLVKRKQDDTIYALKRVELSKMQQNEKDNSLNEIRLLASINHKNIIGYKESFYEESTNTLNIILEYADGGDLQSKISAHKNINKYFNEKTIWSIFIQMVYGLKELHDRNIIHRDLKSANIFLMKDGVCKLGDLNVSKIAKTGLLKTQTGTPYFASPEVWAGKEYGLKSDIWSLGCILYQMATLKMPFQGNNFKEVYSNVSKCKYQPLPNIYSEDLDSIIKKLLRVEPEQRPSCQELIKDPIINDKSKYYLNIKNTLNEEENSNNINNKKNNNKDNKDNNISEKIKKDDDINEEKSIKIKKEKDNSNSKISTSKNENNRLLKTVKCEESKDINDLLPKNKGYKLYNNYRIFKNYDTNPSSTTKDEKIKEADDKLNNDNFTIGYNRKFYNKSNINKYKTINSNFLKPKGKKNNLEEKSDSINNRVVINSNKKNNSNSKAMNKQNSVPYINHRSEGNSSHKKKEKSKEKDQEKEKSRDKERDNIISNDNKEIKIPLLIIKNKLNKNNGNNNSNNINNNNIPRNCISAKARRKALSENKKLKYINNNKNPRIKLKNINNHQYKKITPLNTNNNDSLNNNINNNIINNQKKRLSSIVGYGYDSNQTDIENKETNNTSEKGKSFTYNKNSENKFRFNLRSKQNKNYHSLSKTRKKYKNSDENESNYNKQFRKSIPKSKTINKNISSMAFDCCNVKPNIIVSNLFKEEKENNNSNNNNYDNNNNDSNEKNTKFNYISNKFNNSFHTAQNKKEVKRNNSTFELKNKENQKIFTLHKISTKTNSANGLNIDLNTTTKNKCPIIREKLCLPIANSTKVNETVSASFNINNKKNNNINYHKKILPKKNLCNINFIEYHHNNYNNYNKEMNDKNLYNYTNTASNRMNFYAQSSVNENDLINTNNIHKSISLISMNYHEAYKTQTNNYKKKCNDACNDNIDNIHKKISTFKFDEFKKKKLRKNNQNNNNNNNNNESKKKFIKFNHIPFINTPNKENEPILTKQMEDQDPSLFNHKKKNIDPTIKMLINPIKIIEKKNFKRKLFPVHPQVKLSKLNLMNNTTYKNNNNTKDYVSSVQDD